MSLTFEGAVVDIASMRVGRKPRAGTYARGKYESGLRSYRRRMRWPLLIVAAPMFLFVAAVAGSHHVDTWSFAAGIVLAGAMGLVISTRDDAPQHVLNWKRGAEGERKTEKALRPLERRGWAVEHDIQRDGRANLDHVVTGPPGVFLIESKNLAGEITIEDGLLVARQFDDPDEVYRYETLASRLRGQAKELSARIREETGRGQWVTAVVVVWGHFHSERVEHGSVTYIRGEELRSWLATLQAAPVHRALTSMGTPINPRHNELT